MQLAILYILIQDPIENIGWESSYFRYLLQDCWRRRRRWRLALTSREINPNSKPLFSLVYLRIIFPLPEENIHKYLGTL